MKVAGLLLLPAGWLIVLSAMVLLPAAPARSGFALAGLAVEALGLVVVTRAHIPQIEPRPRMDDRRRVEDRPEERD